MPINRYKIYSILENAIISFQVYYKFYGLEGILKVMESNFNFKNFRECFHFDQEEERFIKKIKKDLDDAFKPIIKELKSAYKQFNLVISKLKNKEIYFY